MSAAVSSAPHTTTEKRRKDAGDAASMARQGYDQASQRGESLLNQASEAVSEAAQSAKENATAFQQNAQAKVSQLEEKSKERAKQLHSQALGGDAVPDAESAAKEAKEAGNKFYEQATALASSTVEYVKSAAGLTQPKASETHDRSKSEIDKTATANGGPTLGNLVNQARDLTGEALGTVKSYVAVGQAKTQEAAGEVQHQAQEAKEGAEEKLKSANQNSYVDQARNLAASVIEQAQNVISTTVNKVEEKSNTTVKSLHEEARDVVGNLKDQATEHSCTLQSKSQEAIDSTSKNLQELSLKGSQKANATVQVVGKAMEDAAGPQSAKK